MVCRIVNCPGSGKAKGIAPPHTGTSLAPGRVIQSDFPMQPRLLLRCDVRMIRPRTQPITRVNWTEFQGQDFDGLQPFYLLCFNIGFSLSSHSRPVFSPVAMFDGHNVGQRPQLKRPPGGTSEVDSLENEFLPEFINRSEVRRIDSVR